MSDVALLRSRECLARALSQGCGSMRGDVPTPPLAPACCLGNRGRRLPLAQRRRGCFGRSDLVDLDSPVVLRVAFDGGSEDRADHVNGGGRAWQASADALRQGAARASRGPAERRRGAVLALPRGPVGSSGNGGLLGAAGSGGAAASGRQCRLHRRGHWGRRGHVRRRCLLGLLLERPLRAGQQRQRLRACGRRVPRLRLERFRLRPGYLSGNTGDLRSRDLRRVL